MPSADARATQDLIGQCSARLDELYAQCHANAPNYGVTQENFNNSVNRTLTRFVESALPGEIDSAATLTAFIDQLQADDLFLALGCAAGNERAWWEFDRQHRSHLERVARHLAKTDLDAQEVIDQVYVDLYGTKIVDGERVSKFATYSGRGSLRGWLRTVIWHSLVDLHRSSHDEVSLDEMTENVGEGMAHAQFAEAAPGGENEMIGHVSRERYRKATVTALETAFSSLDNHEKLLLLYYHVENLKLREIAKLVENEDSILRGWFQRRSQTREKKPGGRIHESTIMRWLEKCYAQILQLFRSELESTHSLKPAEIEICMQLATEDLAANNIFSNLAA